MHGDAHQFLLLSWLLGNSTLLPGLLQGASPGTDFFLHQVTENDETFHRMESQSENSKVILNSNNNNNNNNDDDNKTKKQQFITMYMFL